MKHAFILLVILLSACNTDGPKSENSESLYDYDVEEKIEALGIELSEPGKPVANYVNAVRSGDLIFMAGKGPGSSAETFIKGKIGSDLSIEEGYKAARLTAIEQLSALKSEIGDLNKVVRIVKVFGMVNADPSFTGHSQVINGFSDMMVEVFGERGKHARAAVGMGSLPLNMACEIEMIVEVRD
jgi:enamine deaminase RidA (YjgF/YER057c/UK114 family)